MEKEIVNKARIRDDTERKYVSKGIDTLQGKLQRNYDRAFDMFELVMMQSTFKPPMGLETSEEVVPLTPEQEAELDRELESYYKRLSAAHCTHRALQRELRSCESQIQAFESLVKPSPGSETALLGVCSPETLEKLSKLVQSAHTYKEAVDQLDVLSPNQEAGGSAVSQHLQQRGFVSDVQSTLPIGQAKQLTDRLSR